MRISDWGSDVCSSDLRYRGVADDDGAGRRALPPAGKMEAFAMTVYRAGAGQRSFSLPLTFCVLAVTVLLATGCATQPVRPVPYEQANTASWFSQSGSSDLSESYKEIGRAHV